jgi:general secretion pathway protein D
MKYRKTLLPVLTVLSSTIVLQPTDAQTPATPPPAAPAAPTAPAPAAPTAPAPEAATAPAPQRIVNPAVKKKPEQLFNFAFTNSDLDVVMAQYCTWTEQIYLKTDAVKASITLKADKLTKQECIEVVEAILAMNNIALVPMGDKYIKVVMSTSPDLTGHGLQINMDQEQQYTGTDKFVTQIIQLKHVEIPEVQAAIQHVLHAYGKILALQGSNSLMITDTEANIIRARELIEFIDQPTARIEPRIYQIKYADASEIAGKLNEIITMAQADQKKSIPTSAGNPNARTPAGVIRARATQTAAKAPTKASISNTEGSSTVIIQGTVKVMSDERTNIILIFSQEENFTFFDTIIEVLDVEVEPATTFEVVNLEYADASELAGTLNDLIGASSSSRSSSGGSSSSSASRLRSDTNTLRTGGNSSRSTSSGSRNSSTSRVTPNASAIDSGAIENLNRLSEDTKILADERSNSILLMGEKADIAAIKNVIATLDIMLEQVMIEAAIFEVTLGDELRHGIDWLYRSDNDDKVGAWDGNSLLSPSNSIASVAAGALTYYQNITDINTEIAINLAASDSNVRLLSTPVIITTDNTEARLAVGEQRPIVTSTSSFANSSGTQSSNYEYKDIGINLTVIPRINPQRVVVMEVLQQADQVGGEVSIDGNQVPIILNREFEAQISVPDKGTIALGGLINSETRDAVTKIPILGDLPLIGRYLFSSTSKQNIQTELVVLLTPYVLANLDEAKTQTDRLYDSIDMREEDWPEKNWSGSSLKYREKLDDEILETE